MSSQALLAAGPISVSTKEVDGEWHCTALEFDLLGTGATQDEAFLELQDLVHEYILAMVQHIHFGDDVAFYNPSSPEEWNDGEIRKYQVMLLFEPESSNDDETPERVVQKELGHLFGKIGSVSLDPVPA